MKTHDDLAIYRLKFESYAMAYEASGILRRVTGDRVCLIRVGKSFLILRFDASGKEVGS